MTTVTIQHFRRLGYCARGSRRFFSRHDLDWTSFVREGIDAGELRATGDAMVIRAAELAEAEAGATEENGADE